ncbi:MAG: hypothetical protein AAFY15_02775 [Cyanobacteria bacterium J06648_11]
MPRLIVLLLTLIALALLAVQNLDTPVSLVILSNSLPEIPLGILLVCAIGSGALLTLILYGLVGRRRPPESKYRPMGRRVPSPGDPDSTLPPTGPSPYGQSSPSSYSGSSYSPSSSAFVSEPSNQSSNQPSTPVDEAPPVDAPVDTPPKESPSAPPQDSASRAGYGDSYGAGYRERYDGSYSSSFDADPQPNSRRYESSDSGFADAGLADSGVADSARAASPSGFMKQPIAGIKSVFGKKKDREDPDPDPQKVVGDDWGQIRTTEHKNSWDVGGDTSKVEEGIKGLFKFGRDVTTNAGKIAEDIASGWNDSSDGRNPRRDGNYEPGYVDSDGYGAEQYSEQYYADDSYYPGNRSEGYDSPPSDNLDQGWERFDDYGDDDYGDRTPRDLSSADLSADARKNAPPAKRTYGDSLYSDEEGPYPSRNEDFDEEGFDDGSFDDMEPDGVYDADYRVIEPPSKPLDADDDFA